MLGRVIKELLTWASKSFGLVTFDHNVLRFGFLNFQKAFLFFAVKRWKMAHYYVSKIPKATGEHEVHTNICIALPPSGERLALGYHESSREAVQYASLNFRQAVACKRCC